MARGEISYCHTVAICLNCKNKSQLYKDIYNQNEKEFKFAQKVKEAAARANVLEESHEDMSGNTGGAPQKVDVEEIKADEVEIPLPEKKEEEIIELNKPSEYPNKEPFLQRMRYSREWLDLGEMEMGFPRNIDSTLFPSHEYVIMDVFDIVNDHELRDAFFNKIMG